MTVDPNAYARISSVQAYAPIDTAAWFASSITSAKLSPIDEFIRNTSSINTIYLSGNAPISPELGALIVLGYMSAVEGFFRALIRRLINTDQAVHKLVEPMNVSFGAALHHKKELLPEAILESSSFASKRNIEETFKQILGLRGAMPIEVSKVLSDFSRICEIRHCCVHRFGRLGANNAIRLGLDGHANYIEKPFSPTQQALAEIADVLRNFIKVVNNYIFRSVLDRTANIGAYHEKGFSQTAWKWNYVEDRKKFLVYYNSFASTLDNPPSPLAKQLYDSFRLACKK